MSEISFTLPVDPLYSNEIKRGSTGRVKEIEQYSVNCWRSLRFICFESHVSLDVTSTLIIEISFC